MLEINELNSLKVFCTEKSKSAVTSKRGLKTSESFRKLKEISSINNEFTLTTSHNRVIPLSPVLHSSHSPLRVAQQYREDSKPKGVEGIMGCCTALPPTPKGSVCYTTEPFGVGGNAVQQTKGGTQDLRSSPSGYRQKQYKRLTQIAYYQAGKTVIQTLLPQHPPVSLIMLNPIGVTSLTSADIYIPNEGTSNTQYCSSLESQLIGFYGGKATSQLFEYQSWFFYPYGPKHNPFIRTALSPQLPLHDSLQAYSKTHNISRPLSIPHTPITTLPHTIFSASQAPLPPVPPSVVMGVRKVVQQPCTPQGDRGLRSSTGWRSCTGVAGSSPLTVSFAGAGNNCFQSNIGNIEIQTATRLASIMVNNWDFYSFNFTFVGKANDTQYAKLFERNRRNKDFSKDAYLFFKKNHVLPNFQLLFTEPSAISLLELKDIPLLKTRGLNKHGYSITTPPALPSPYPHYCYATRKGYRGYVQQAPLPLPSKGVQGVCTSNPFGVRGNVGNPFTRTANITTLGLQSSTSRPVPHTYPRRGSEDGKQTCTTEGGNAEPIFINFDKNSSLEVRKASRKEVKQTYTIITTFGLRNSTDTFSGNSSYSIRRISIENVGKKQISRIGIFQLINSLQFSNVQRDRFYLSWFRVYLPDIEATAFLKSVANYFFCLGLQTLLRPSIGKLTPRLCLSSMDLKSACGEKFSKQPKTSNFFSVCNLALSAEKLTNRVPIQHYSLPALPPSITIYPCTPEGGNGFDGTASSVLHSSLRKDSKSGPPKVVQGVQGCIAVMGSVCYTTEGGNAVQQAPYENMPKDIRNVFFCLSEGAINNNLNIGLGPLRSVAKRRNQTCRGHAKSQPFFNISAALSPSITISLPPLPPVPPKVVQGVMGVRTANPVLNSSFREDSKSVPPKGIMELMGVVGSQHYSQKEHSVIFSPQHYSFGEYSKPYTIIITLVSQNTCTALSPSITISDGTANPVLHSFLRKDSNIVLLRKPKGGSVVQASEAVQQSEGDNGGTNDISLSEIRNWVVSTATPKVTILFHPLKVRKHAKVGKKVVMVVKQAPFWEREKFFLKDEENLSFGNPWERIKKKNVNKNQVRYQIGTKADEINSKREQFSYLPKFITTTTSQTPLVGAGLRSSTGLGKLPITALPPTPVPPVPPVPPSGVMSSVCCPLEERNAVQQSCTPKGGFAKLADVSSFLLLEKQIFPMSGISRRPRIPVPPSGVQGVMSLPDKGDTVSSNRNNINVEKELISRALINNCFTKAFLLINQNRQLLDYFVDYLIRFQILRQHQILYLFSAILLNCKK